MRQPVDVHQAGRLEIGALGFNFSPVFAMRPLIDSYKEGIASCEEPIGEFLNDNVMITNSVVCMEDRDRAREIVTRYGRGYLYSLVCLYHDTIPVPPNAPVWPEPPNQLGAELVDWAIEAGYLLCGTPDEVCEQIARGHQAVGVDQLVFGVPGGAVSHEETLEILEVFDKRVIPSSTRTRCTAPPATGSRPHRLARPSTPPPELEHLVGGRLPWRHDAHRGEAGRHPHRRRRPAVGRHRRRQQAQGPPGQGHRGPLDRPEHLPGRTPCPLHRHTGPVWGYTISGAWHYKEYDYVNRAGSFLYEPAGSVHTLECIEDDTNVWFQMYGANLNLDAEGNIESVFDGPGTWPPTTPCARPPGCPSPTSSPSSGAVHRNGVPVNRASLQ